MSLYNGPEELLHDAANKGIINIRGLNIRIGELELHTPAAINVLKPNDWKDFLQNIVDNSDNDQEINCASTFLTMFSQAEHQHDMQIKNLRNPINEQDVANLRQELDKCNTINDVLGLIGNNTITQPPTQLAQPQPAQPTQPAQPQLAQARQLPDQLHWKQPVNVHGKCRYYAHDLDWYVERQLSNGPNGGIIVYYSIFSSNGKEIARFDKLKEAKNNMIPVIKQLG